MWVPNPTPPKGCLFRPRVSIGRAMNLPGESLRRQRHSNDRNRQKQLHYQYKILWGNGKCRELSWFKPVYPLRNGGAVSFSRQLPQKKKKEDPKDSRDVITETGKRLKWDIHVPLCIFHPKSDLHQQQKSVGLGSLQILSKKNNTWTLWSPLHIQL